MTMSELLPWLKATIEGDKALAESVEDPAEISMGAEFVGNCGSDEAAEHIGLHDTEDTIARCKAELALLDRCAQVMSSPETYNDVARSFAEEVVEALAATRRHRPGFKPEWAGGEQP